MAKGCKKCDPHEICEECPEWIFTLADLIMCMMGLFVILWVLKPGITTPPVATNAGANEQISDNDVFLYEMSRGFGGYELNPTSTNPIEIEAIRRRRGKGLGGETNIQRDTPKGTDEQGTTIRPGNQPAVGGKILFDPGSTRFTAETLRNLEEIAKIIKGHRNIILVKGHTSLDDLPEDASAEEKMAISLQRAKSVADYITSKGVEPEILRVQGCSTFEPVKQRAYSPDALQLNRRVEVVSTSNLVEELQDRPSTTTKAPGEAAKESPADSHAPSGHGSTPPADHGPAHAAPAAHGGH